MWRVCLGFGRPGNFYDEGWQKDLSNNQKPSEHIRQGVLMRMRLPYDTEFTQARAGQAYPYFMPSLAGDAGAYLFSLSKRRLISLIRAYQH